MKPRRSRFELCMEIIGLCKSPGLARSSLVTKANVNSAFIIDILFGLVNDRLLETETRKISPKGKRRITDYYILTPEGAELIKDFHDVRGRITSQGAQSESRSPRRID